MPSAGAIHLVGGNDTEQQGEIKLRDNDDDKNNICAIKDHRSCTANVPQLSKVKVKWENRVAYLSVVAFILILCSSVLFVCLRYGQVNRAPVEDEAFRRHLTSDFVTEEIRRITRNVILEEMPSLLAAIYNNDRTDIVRELYQDNQDEAEDDDAAAVQKMINNERKMIRPKRSNFRSENGLAPQPADQPSGPVVEFFNPKIRHELEKKDADYLKRNGGKGAAPGGDAWVWLTSYSRIPAEAITGFCRATKEYCPVGPPGLPGIPGPKGNRGEVGLPGPPGVDGKEGGLGPRGPKGERGLPGAAGLDGRDGVPGEPGLDGIPGRAGSDGIPGRDGINGTPGNDGRNGINGQDGATGPIGPPGPPGIGGEKGLSGPRGRAGKAGTNGTPGIPGVNTWRVKVNGTYSNELLIPPSMMGGSTLSNIVVQEKDNLRLRCASTGNPKPEIEWRLLNGHIPNGAWSASSISGHTLNITKINRVHMGVYRCFADNGIPPAANATFNVEVHFAPFIRVRKPILYAPIGTHVVLECEVEAFPDPVRYWERASDRRLLEPGPRYRIETTNDGYKSTMRLNMTVMSSQDYDKYHCVSKNELGQAAGDVVIDGSVPLNHPLGKESSAVIHGNEPPKREPLDDICPEPAPCKDCMEDHKEKCKDTILSLHDLIGIELEITPTKSYKRYPGLVNRTQDVVLNAVGKPIYHKAADNTYGAWMKDPQPANDKDAEKIWVTHESYPGTLTEYPNKIDFRLNKKNSTHQLKPPFYGNAHTVYNGSFYYQEVGQPRVFRHRLGDGNKINMTIPNAVGSGQRRLYTVDYNYFDFNVDENGLWLIYGLSNSNNTVVTKLDENNLEIQYSWNISVNHKKVSEMFIVSGVLYAIDSGKEKMAKIRFALDLYTSKLLDVDNLIFTNPFRNTTNVAYNHRSKELFTWDKGNQLTYPTRSNAMDNKLTSMERGEDVQMVENQSTGYEKY